MASAGWRRAAGGALLAASVAGLGITAMAAAPGKATGAPKAGMRVTDFRLEDPSGGERSLRDFAQKQVLVLVFTGTECPISNDYSQPLTQLAAQYAPKGVQFLGVNALPYESVAAVAKHAKEYALGFPVLKDPEQKLARTLDARVTPEVFVLDSSRVVRYRGRVNDAYASRTQKRRHVRSHDLKNAIEAVLAKKPVETPVTTAYGCAIPRDYQTAAAKQVTYYRDVAPIIQESCQGCHRPGQVAPFSLSSYQDARSWAAEIKSFSQSRQMPPWQAAPGHGDFLDARRLTDEQIATLARWADAGAPAGNPKDAPAPKEWKDEWSLGTPDLVLEMPEEYTVGANGEDDFRCFVIPTGLKEDKQVVAVDIRPGNARVVHHVLNFLDTGGAARRLDEKDPLPGYNSGPGGIGILPSGSLGGWAPGNFARYLPKGVGMPLPANSDLVMQVHYHKTGKVEKDRTRVGLYFAKEPVEKRLRVFPLTNLAIHIPPGEKRWKLEQTLTVPWDVQLISITPHMHLLGKEMEVTAELPDGTRKPLIWVKDWDYRWQDTYRYRELQKVPKGTKIKMTAYFDNSSDNPRNPNDPPKLVRFGEQTTDEMAFAFIEFVHEQEPAGGSPGGFLSLLFGGN
ncbi:MAG: redoxin domain-containing protein [Armatimonadota bacterium]